MGDELAVSVRAVLQIGLPAAYVFATAKGVNVSVTYETCPAPRLRLTTTSDGVDVVVASSPSITAEMRTLGLVALTPSPPKMSKSGIVSVRWKRPKSLEEPPKEPKLRPRPAADVKAGPEAAFQAAVAVYTRDIDAAVAQVLETAGPDPVNVFVLAAAPQTGSIRLCQIGLVQDPERRPVRLFIRLEKQLVTPGVASSLIIHIRTRVIPSLAKAGYKCLKPTGSVEMQNGKWIFPPCRCFCGDGGYSQVVKPDSCIWWEFTL